MSDTIPNSSEKTAAVLREQHVARIGNNYEAHSQHGRQV